MQKIAVISDVHSNYWTLKKAIEDAKERKVDTFFFCGDYITDGFMNNEVIDEIRKLNGYVVLGNRDEEILDYAENRYEIWPKLKRYHSRLYAYNDLREDNLEYIKTLPKYVIVEIEGKKFCIAHSTPYDTGIKPFEDNLKHINNVIDNYNFDVYVFGHYHLNFYMKYKGREFINPGSVGQSLDGNRWIYTIITIDNDIKYENVKIEYEFEKIEKAYLDSDYYQQCQVWGDIVLKTMESSKDIIDSFISTLEQLEKNTDGSVESSNIMWEKAYKLWKKQHHN